MSQESHAQGIQMQRILDAIHEGILLLDPQGGVHLSNASGRKALTFLADPEDTQRIRSIGGQTLSDLLAQTRGKPPLQLSSKGSNPRTFELLSLPDLGAEGWTLLRVRDITEEQQLLRRSMHQERLAAVGQLAAGIAHDFNNIMAAIILYSEMLLAERGLSSQGRERLEVLIHQGQRAVALTQQILDFSRQGVISLRPLALGPFLVELQKVLARMLPETIRVTAQSQAAEVVVNADPTRMQQVFMNLAVNARDAMPDGGEFRVQLDSVVLERGAAMPFPGMEPGGWIRVRVMDTGVGIPPGVLPRVFEPFFTTKGPGEGTGLGLAQVYGIVKQHGGFIDVTSLEGKGTTFEIYLPAASGDVSSPVGAAQPEDRQARRQTILVVEDDLTTRTALQEVLETFNYCVLAAANGREALAVLEKEAGRVRLVLSDLVMPEMGGKALFDTVREKYPDIRMVIMTGYPRIRGTRELLEYGRVHWIQKPVGAKDLAEALEQALGRERTRPTGARSTPVNSA